MKKEPFLSHNVMTATAARDALIDRHLLFLGADSFHEQLHESVTRAIEYDSKFFIITVKQVLTPEEQETDKYLSTGMRAAEVLVHYGYNINGMSNTDSFVRPDGAVEREYEIRASFTGA